MTITDAARDEWIANRKPANGFLREGSVRIYRSVEGTGIAPGIDAYPHQYLDIATEPYDYPWLVIARADAKITRACGFEALRVPSAGARKHPGMTPLGTSVATLRREGHDMLAAACGYCGRNISKCAGDCSALCVAGVETPRI